MLNVMVMQNFFFKLLSGMTEDNCAEAIKIALAGVGVVVVVFLGRWRPFFIVSKWQNKLNEMLGVIFEV